MNSREPELAPLFLFESTTHVMWAEEVALDEGIPVEIVPGPRGVADVCGLALRTLPGRVGVLEALLAREGIGFRRYRP